MNNNKERERAELHRTIWQIANDLRGSVDGWDFKQYVLGMLFYRFISENLENHIDKNEHESGNKDFKYRDLSDDMAEFARKQMIDEKGFFILPSELFSNVVKKSKTDENLNMTLEKVFRDIEGSAIGTPSEDSFKGLFDDIDVNSNKLGRTVVEKNLFFEEVKIKESLSYIDALTDTFNRRYLNIEAPKLLESDLSNFIGVAFLDIDDFKTINDEYGHHFGDIVLSEISKTISKNLTGKDSLIRYGGDEFIILMFADTKEEITRLVDKLKMLINATIIPYNGLEIKADVSLGLSNV